MTARVLAIACALGLSGAGYDDALRDARQASGAHSMAGAVMERGAVVWAGAVGPGALTTDVYSLASLSKTYTAVLVLRLAERGVLSLDDPVSTWLAGQVPAAAGAVTVRELLDHTSGLPDYLGDRRIDRALRDPWHRWREAELLRAVRAPRRRGHFSYSNTNYVLLGAVVRRAASTPPAVLLDTEVLAPLGLASTSMRRSSELAARVAGGWRLGTGVWGPLWTDGGVVATAQEVATFLDALVVRGTVLAPATLEAMLPAAGGYGLGVAGYRLGGATYHGHDGLYGPWSSLAVASRDTGLTFAVLARGGAADGPDRAIRALAGAA